MRGPSRPPVSWPGWLRAERPMRRPAAQCAAAIMLHRTIGVLRYELIGAAAPRLPGTLDGETSLPVRRPDRKWQARLGRHQGDGRRRRPPGRWFRSAQRRRDCPRFAACRDCGARCPGSHPRHGGCEPGSRHSGRTRTADQPIRSSPSFARIRSRRTRTFPSSCRCHGSEARNPHHPGPRRHAICPDRQQGAQNHGRRL